MKNMLKFLKKTPFAVITAVMAFSGLFLMVSCGGEDVHWHDWDWDGSRYGRPYKAENGLRRCQLYDTCDEGPAWPNVAGSTSGPVQAGPGDIGPAGGIIIYVTNSSTGFNFYTNAETVDIINVETIRCNYLEAAPFFQVASNYSWPTQALQRDDFNITFAIGTGLRNTLVMEKANKNNPMVRGCLDFSLNGYDDWFLPSNDELNSLYSQRNALRMRQGFYWSSTPSLTNSANAWVRDFNHNQRGEIPKTEKAYYFPIRAF